MDFIERGFSERTGIRVFYVDVTQTAITLEQRHLSGPTAGRILGEAVAAVALLSAELESDDESVSLQIKTDGPIGGAMADASGAGNLRAYTHQKILNQFDGEEKADLSAVMGAGGQMAVIRSNSKRILSVGQVSARPPSLRVGLARYYNDSQQTPTAVELYTLSREGYLKRAVGIVADRMPGGDQEAFCSILERFNSGAVLRFLDSSEGVLDFKELFAVDDLVSRSKRDLQFGCNCNYDKIAQAISTLPDDEIREILGANHSQRVTCHFCGEVYTVREETLREILEASENDSANVDEDEASESNAGDGGDPDRTDSSDRDAG